MNASENPLTGLSNLQNVRYVTISGVSVLVYDTLISLPDEIHYVWLPLFHWVFRLHRNGLERNRSKATSALPKILLLLTRYTMLAISAIYLIALIPSFALNTNWCRSAVSAVFCFDVLIETVGSGVVLRRLYSLWNFSSRGTCALVGGFVLAKTVSLTYSFVIIGVSRDEIFFLDSGDIRVCFTDKVPRFGLGAWIAAVVFDVFTFALLLLNALSRPRVESQRLLDILYKDGIFFFVTVICMRMLNVIFNAFAPPSLFYIGIIFSGTIVTTASSRLFLQLLCISNGVGSLWWGSSTDSGNSTVSGATVNATLNMENISECTLHQIYT